MGFFLGKNIFSRFLEKIEKTPVNGYYDDTNFEFNIEPSKNTWGMEKMIDGKNDWKK